MNTFSCVGFLFLSSFCDLLTYSLRQRILNEIKLGLVIAMLVFHLSQSYCYFWGLYFCSHFFVYLSFLPISTYLHGKDTFDSELHSDPALLYSVSQCNLSFFLYCEIFLCKLFSFF